MEPKQSLNKNDTHLYFIKEGCARLFVVNFKGEDVNLGFVYGNTLVTCFQTFIEEKPSQITVEAIFETHLVGIAKRELMDLAYKRPDVAAWYQKMLEYTLIGHIQRQVELLTLTPKERYSVFLKRSGHLVNRIPLKFIASYLSMSPETLSRIRAKILD